MATASTTTINIVPVQGIFNEDHSLVTLIGPAGTPFDAPISPDQSGLNITNSTINSSIIGGTIPAAGTFTNLATATGTITSSPYNPSDIANKQYVDQVAAGLSVKAPVVCASTANIATLSGLLTLDGITVIAGDRVLIKNQIASQNNGIYVAAAGAWSRSTDCSTWDQLIGAFCFVSTGSTLADTGWVCTIDKGGTLGTTPIPWVQFAGLALYTAGTGLTLTGTQFSITNTGVTAAAYGSASSVANFTVNAQGQLTLAASTAIAIAATQVTSGTFASSLLSGVYSGITGLGTLVDLTVTNAIVGSITGNAATATSASTAGSATTAGFATSAGSVINSVTFNNAGSGGASGSTYNGGSALTVSYNTVGAPSTSGTGASGTWGISVTGNAATVTNGVVTTGSYSNPTWLTSISGSIVSGAVSSATTATNLAGGLAGSLPYQTGAGATSMLALGTNGYVLTAGASAPGYVAQSTLSVGSATTATTSTNLAGGGAGSVPYQSGAGATSFVSSGTVGYVLTSNGTSAPTWAAAAGGVTLSDDTTTAATRYPLFADATSGSASTIYTSSTKYQYNPSTGILTATGFSGSGASLTGLSASNISAGTLAVAYGGTGLTSTPANGALDIGNGTGFTRTTLTAGTGISITNASGSITVAATSSGATITDDTTTNAVRYLSFTAATSGALNTLYTSSTKLKYNPSTGAVTASQIIIAP